MKSGKTCGIKSRQSCLIVLAHGSRGRRWQRYFRQLLEDLGKLCGVSGVKLAFLEIARPSLKETAANLAYAGFSRLDVLPLFIAGGGHVDRDIPLQVAELRKQFPTITFRLLKPIGEQPPVRRAILKYLSRLMG